jgi:hypothetical protein
VSVPTGPVQENVKGGNELDLAAIPTPKWHEQDGGRYIGTGCMVVMKDPDLTGSITAPTGSRYTTAMSPPCTALRVSVAA